MFKFKEDKMNKKIDFELNNEQQKKINVLVAVELIKKILYKEDKISKEEFNNVVKNANRSVKIC